MVQGHDFDLTFFFSPVRSLVEPLKLREAPLDFSLCYLDSPFHMIQLKSVLLNILFDQNHLIFV